MDSPGLTGLLHAWRNGDAGALDRLVPIVYDELHRLASIQLRGRTRSTLRPTDLVSEAYLRLAGTGAPPDWNDRVHFFAVAARILRQILVDHARRRAAHKRGGDRHPVTYDEDLVATTDAPELTEIDDAIDELAKIDARKARVIELHYFGGLSQAEVAQVLEVHVNTVARDLRLAEAWLCRHVQHE